MESLNLRKKNEEKHYDSKALKEDFFISENGSDSMNPFLSSPYVYAEQWIMGNCQNKKVLDFGCGQGTFSVFPTQSGAEVVGVDISSKSLEFSKERARRGNLLEKTNFIKGDCEDLPFEERSFDIILSYGTLSCLDVKRAYLEMSRVLKADGKVIIVDTLGYNPILNLNRWIKYKRGLRTRQTVENILKMGDVYLANRYFEKIESIKFFDFTTVFLASLTRNKNWWGWLFRALKKIDDALFELSFFRYLAFKVVFVLSKPRK